MKFSITSFEEWLIKRKLWWEADECWLCSCEGFIWSGSSLYCIIQGLKIRQLRGHSKKRDWQYQGVFVHELSSEARDGFVGCEIGE